MAWRELWAAFALVLVMEGLVLFVCPDLMKQIMVIMARRGDTLLRLFGCGGMAVGLVLLYLAR